jgi:hypothetical protein
VPQSRFAIPVVCALLLSTNSVPIPNALAQDAKDIIATQLRAQGYACDNPLSATREPKASRPNETVWIVVCGNASYRATLVPNMAARVETLPREVETDTAE